MVTIETSTRRATPLWSARVSFLFGIRRYFTTTSFIRVETSRQRLLDKVLATSVSAASRLRPGDIVYYKTEGINAPWSHASIVSRVTPSGAYIAQHSTDKQQLLSDQIAKIRDEQQAAGDLR